MDATTEAALNLTSVLAQALADRVPDIRTWREYYDGDQPLQFATPEYREVFEEQYVGFSDNWCATVADAVPEKLNFAGLRLPAAAENAKRLGDDKFARIWDLNEGPSESSMGWTEASVCKRTFALVWGEGEDGETPEITFEAADQCIVMYEPGSRRRRRAALKVWQQDEHYEWAVLYTRPNLFRAGDGAKVWKWKRRTATAGQSKLIVVSWSGSWVGTSGGWEARADDDDTWPLDNPSDVVPLIELRNRPKLVGDPISEVEVVAPMQDAVNVLWSYLFSSGDFAALPQRVLLNAVLPKIPILDKDGKPTGTFKTAEELIEPVLRRRVAAFQGGQGQRAEIAEWTPADLTAFTQVIAFAVGHIAAKSRTEITRFTGGSTIANVNEGGMKALQAASIDKLRERATYYAVDLREIAATSYLMLGDEGGAEQARRATVEWDDFEIRSDAALGDKMIKYKQAGFSQHYLASMVIKDPEELKDELDRQAQERKDNADAFNFGDTPPAT